MIQRDIRKQIRIENLEKINEQIRLRIEIAGYNQIFDEVYKKVLMPIFDEVWIQTSNDLRKL